MIKGIHWQPGMKCGELKAAGFTCLEYQYGEGLSGALPEEPFRSDQNEMTGAVVAAGYVYAGGLDRILGWAADSGVSYLVIETAGAENEDGERLYDGLKASAGTAGRHGIHIYIENGYYKNGSRFYQNVFSDAEFLKRLADRLNHRRESLPRESAPNVFGICVNIGYANLLGQNICGMLEVLGDRICLIHANDNDGTSNQRQLPFTFTKGRGQLITDWYGIVGMLVRNRYQGPIVFDTAGLFEISPKPLYPAWYGLLAAVAGEWEKFFQLEEDLRSRDHRILFGSGRMFENYMQVWGRAYPPAFAVDNNEALWGKEKMGVKICPPEEMFKIPENERLVLVCNMYYEAIERQLAGMGIQSRRYDDKYFFRH